MVVGVPLDTVAPEAGAVIAEVGAVVSVEAVAATRPACNVAGWACMSASRFTVACSIVMLGALGPVSGFVSWLVSRPHAHCTVPAEKTSAPLDTRYSVGLQTTVAGV